MGACRQQWMPFRPPFLTAGEQFVKNTSSHRIKWITQLFYQIMLKPVTAPSTNPFGRGYLCWIGLIHRSHAVGGANGSTMVVIFVDCCVDGGWYFLYYSYSRNPTGREFFVPAGTLIAVKLLTVPTKCTIVLLKCFPPVWFVTPLLLIGAILYLAAFFNKLTMKNTKKCPSYVPFLLSEQIFARCRCLVASSEALNFLHWAMCTAT